MNKKFKEIIFNAVHYGNALLDDIRNNWPTKSDYDCSKLEQYRDACGSSKQGRVISSYIELMQCAIVRDDTKKYPLCFSHPKEVKVYINKLKSLN